MKEKIRYNMKEEIINKVIKKLEQMDGIIKIPREKDSTYQKAMSLTYDETISWIMFELRKKGILLTIINDEEVEVGRRFYRRRLMRPPRFFG